MSVSWLLNKNNEEKQKGKPVVDKDSQVLALPQSRAEFNYLYNTVIGTYQIEDSDMTKYDFCEAIGSLGLGVSEVRLGYLGDFLKRRIAHKVTYEVITELRKKFQEVEQKQKQEETLKQNGVSSVGNNQDQKR
jgi:hypothetical protein